MFIVSSDLSCSDSTIEKEDFHKVIKDNFHSSSRKKGARSGVEDVG